MFRNLEINLGFIAMLFGFVIVMSIIAAVTLSPDKGYRVLVEQDCQSDTVKEVFMACLVESHSENSYASQTDIRTCQEEVAELLCETKEKIVWLDTREEGEWK